MSAVSPIGTAWNPYTHIGWHLVPIPPGGKGPKTQGWNRKENTITDPNMIPSGHGIGLAHAYSGTMALDIDNWDRAAKELAEHEIDLQALFDAPNAVIINSGNPGHGKLIYAMPFGLAMNSKNLIDAQPDGSRKSYLDFRCATSDGLTVQDCLPPTIHPTTLRPYTWGGKGNWQHLPVIPDNLLTFWRSLVEQDQERSITNPGTVDASWDEIRSALFAISPDVGREEWVQIGMALHYAGHHTNQEDQAIVLWDEWSAQSTLKYKGQRDILTQWRSFKPDPTGVTLGTLFHIARQSGWSRPAPDVTSMFAPIPEEDSFTLEGELVQEPPECDISLFPDVLTRRARVMEKEYAADPLVPIWAGLGAACAAADSRIRLTLMADWKVPPILWLMTLGSPSAKKSPASKPMLRVLSTLESEDAPRYRAELLRFEASDAAYAASKGAYLKAAGDANNILGGNLDMKSLPPVIAQPDKPIPLRMTVTDVTSQKLVRIAAERPRGVLCYMDEMKSWTERLSDPKSGENRSCWVTGYESDKYVMDRVGDGKSDSTYIADPFSVSIYGNLQPRVFQDALKSMSSDGLVQRFIFAVLRDYKSDMLNDPKELDPQGLEQYEMAIRTIAALPPQEYRLSDGAYAKFREFQSWYIQRKQDERLLEAVDVYQEALGKLEGTCGRIALVFHLLSDPFNPEVSSETMARACAVTQSYIVPALAYVYMEIADLDSTAFYQWIMRHIVYQAGHVATISLSDIRRSARRQIAKVGAGKVDLMIRDGMDWLATRGYVSLLSDKGRIVTWAINPKIANREDKYRQGIVEAKQRLYDGIHRKGSGKIKRSKPQVS